MEVGGAILEPRAWRRPPRSKHAWRAGRPVLGARKPATSTAVGTHLESSARSATLGGVRRSWAIVSFSLLGAISAFRVVRSRQTQIKSETLDRLVLRLRCVRWDSLALFILNLDLEIVF
jgi:hypothetical protein